MGGHHGPRCDGLPDTDPYRVQNGRHAKDQIPINRTLVLLCLIVITTGVCPADARYYGKPKCKERGLHVRTNESSVVLIGKVESLGPDPLHKQQSVGVVRVKRKLKGDIPGYPESLWEYNSQVRVSIEGFGNPLICESVVRPGDTKIFLLSDAQGGRYRLASSVVRITLSNLVYADHAVKRKYFDNNLLTSIVIAKHDTTIGIYRSL